MSLIKTVVPKEVMDLFTRLQKGSAAKKSKDQDPPPKWLAIRFDVDDDKLSLAGQGAKDPEEAKMDEDKVAAYHQTAYQNFVKSMQANAPCFGVLDYHGKIFFVSYIPDQIDGKSVKPKLKMTLASVKNNVHDQLKGCHFNMQCSDKDDLDESEFKAKLPKI